jgi:hypothetical protein
MIAASSYSVAIRLQKEVADLVFRRKLDVRKRVTPTFPLKQNRRGDRARRESGPGATKVVVAPR